VIKIWLSFLQLQPFVARLGAEGEVQKPDHGQIFTFKPH